MAITIRATSTGPNSNATSTSINLPAGTVVGDLTIIGGSTTASSGNYTITLPSGWTAVMNGGGQFVCYRRFQTGDPASVTFTYSATVWWNTCAISYIGCDATTPVDAASSCIAVSQTGSTVAGFYRAPSVGPSFVNDLLVAVYTYASVSGAGTITLPGSFTQRVQMTSGPNVNISDRQLSSAANTGVQTATWAGATGTLCSGALVALHAAGDTPAVQAPKTVALSAVIANAAAASPVTMGLDRSGAQVGDLLVLAVPLNQPITSGPAGWLQQINTNGLSVYTKTYAAGDPNPVVTFSGPGIANSVLLALRSNPASAVDVYGSGAGSTTTVLPSLMPTGSSEYFLGIVGQGNTTATTWTPAAGLTTQVNSGAGTSILIQDLQGVSAASGTFSIGSSNAAAVQGLDMLVSVGAVTAGAGAQARALVMA